MNLIRCEHGHLYDADSYDSCPCCKNSIEAEVGNNDFYCISCGKKLQFSDILNYCPYCGKAIETSKNMTSDKKYPSNKEIVEEDTPVLYASPDVFRGYVYASPDVMSGKYKNTKKEKKLFGFINRKNNEKE